MKNNQEASKKDEESKKEHESDEESLLSSSDEDTEYPKAYGTCPECGCNLDGHDDKWVLDGVKFHHYCVTISLRNIIAAFIEEAEQGQKERTEAKRKRKEDKEKNKKTKK
jgi:hypothetical protein